MNQSLGWLDLVVFPIFLTWFIGLILVLFRKDIEIQWKISFIFLFVVYMVVFGKEWANGLDRLEANPGWEIRSWIYSIGKLTFYFLFLIWPITMIRMFYSVSREWVSRTASLLITITVIFWFFFWLYYQFQLEVDKFFDTRFLEFFQ
ncbi:hypothetical protein [Leptospira sp. GIMC2001]|uniref:hypothetical protein n=1 Tax=Leptospira sp. GIMC2001 TaxID=1513297 RepID=UPI002349EAE0|nr:hypothetical protein [Leptospira sp. GIMC2001]WCL50520.1 hypothetical protein O4O04_06785 [Leptospira sp. GIMC2001]